MHRTLVELAFKKARRDLIEEGVSEPSLERQTKYLYEKIKYKYSEKTLKNLYNKATKNTYNKVAIKREEVILCLCKYLGYSDFHSFTQDYPPETEKKGKKKLVFQITISVAFALVIFFSIMAIMPQKRWMEWQDTEYVQVPFDAEKLSKGQLRLYKEERIEHFKKIKPDCDTYFFKPDGRENLWYGKNEQGKLQYFTDYGLHPETGKTLKPITSYMIRKYICEDY